jgi:hypothetical protein
MLYIGSVAAMGSFAGAEQSSEAGQPSAKVQAPKPPSPPTTPPDEELAVEPEEEDDPWDPDEEPALPEEEPDPDPPLELPFAPVLPDPEHAATLQAMNPIA